MMQHIDTLAAAAAAAAKAHSGLEAMQFAQAASNLASAARVMKDVVPPKPLTQEELMQSITHLTKRAMAEGMEEVHITTILENEIHGIVNDFRPE